MGCKSARKPLRRNLFTIAPGSSSSHFSSNLSPSCASLAWPQKDCWSFLTLTGTFLTSNLTHVFILIDLPGPSPTRIPIDTSLRSTTLSCAGSSGINRTRSNGPTLCTVNSHNNPGCPLTIPFYSATLLEEFHERGGTREQIESTLKNMPFVRLTIRTHCLSCLSTTSCAAPRYGSGYYGSQQ